MTTLFTPFSASCMSQCKEKVLELNRECFTRHPGTKITENFNEEKYQKHNPNSWQKKNDKYWYTTV